MNTDYWVTLPLVEWEAAMNRIKELEAELEDLKAEIAGGAEPRERED